RRPSPCRSGSPAARPGSAPRAPCCTASCTSGGANGGFAWTFASQSGTSVRPDGAHVIYSVAEPSGWNTYKVPTLGGDPQLFLQNASGLTWLSDGRLLFSAQRGSIHMGIVAAAPARTDEHDVYWPAHQRGMAHFSYPSPDGRWALVIEMDHHPNWLPCRLVPVDGSSPGREVGPAEPCTAAGWSPDGAWMYFTAGIDGQGQLWRQRFPNGKPEQLTF